MGAGRQGDSFEHVSNVVKYLMFFFNFVFWLIGAAFIGVGIWAYIEKEDYDYGQPDDRDLDIFDLLFDLTVLLIVLGAVMFVLAFTGCVGALRENIFLLKFFSYFLAALFITEIILAILAFLFHEEIETEVTDLLQDELIIRYREDPDLENFINWVQETFECCGVGIKSYADWSLNPYFNCTETNPSVERCAVPYSCCVTENNIDPDIINVMCGFNTQSLSTLEASDIIFTDGCVDAMMEFAEDHMYIIGGVALGLAVPQIFGIVLGFFLIKEIEHDKEVFQSTLPPGNSDRGAALERF